MCEGNHLQSLCHFLIFVQVLVDLDSITVGEQVDTWYTLTPRESGKMKTDVKKYVFYILHVVFFWPGNLKNLFMS